MFLAAREQRFEEFIDHALKVTDEDSGVHLYPLKLSGWWSQTPKFTERWPVRAVLMFSDRPNCLPGAILAGEKPVAEPLTIAGSSCRSNFWVPNAGMAGKSRRGLTWWLR